MLGLRVALLYPILVITACSEPPAAPSESTSPVSADLRWVAGWPRQLALCPTPHTITTRAAIGPEGGSLATHYASLTIPPGALDETVEIRMSHPAGPFRLADLSADAREQFAFARPIQIQLSYDRCMTPRARQWPFRIVLIDRQAREPIQTFTATDDPSAATLTFVTPTFSTYAVAY